MNNTYRQHGKNSGYTSFDGKKLKTMKAFSAVFALVVMGLMLFMMGTFAEKSIENIISGIMLHFYYRVINSSEFANACGWS